MRDRLNTGFENRLKVAAEAKRALVGKLRAQPTCTDPQHDVRASLRAAELALRRKAHADDRQSRRDAASQMADEAQRSRQEAAEAAQRIKRGHLKERKALSSAEAKAKRDAKYAARKARR
jgi:hypothetical protein